MNRLHLWYALTSRFQIDFSPKPRISRSIDSAYLRQKRAARLPLMILVNLPSVSFKYSLILSRPPSRLTQTHGRQLPTQLCHLPTQCSGRQRCLGECGRIQCHCNPICVDCRKRRVFKLLISCLLPTFVSFDHRHAKRCLYTRVLYTCSRAAHRHAMLRACCSMQACYRI